MTAEQMIREEISKGLLRAYPPTILSLQDVADLLGFSYQHTQKDIVCQESFPKRLDRFKVPRWSRKEVLEWAGVTQA